MTRGVDALWSRHVLGLLSDSLASVQVGDFSEAEVAAAKSVLYAGLSAGVTAAPRDPAEAARATQSYASSLLLQQQDVPAKERLPALQAFSRRDFKRAGQALPEVVTQWRALTDTIPPEVMAADQAFADRCQAMLESPPSVVLMVERGVGPRKIQEGEYGEVLQIVPSHRPMSEPAVTLAGSRIEPLWMDNLAWQAATRGGRGVDGFLKGKAIFKDTSLITGVVLLELSEAAHYNENEQLADALAVAGVLLAVASVVTNPSADIRQWEMLPEGYYLVAANPPPGSHTLTIDSRQYTIEVPVTGQLVALIPRLAPGGTSNIAPR